jgi:5-methylcytosine-specific restriction endonuclease McrA
MFSITKKCTQCGKMKSVSDFYKNKTHKDGLDSQCKECVRENVRKYRVSNPEKIKQNKIEWVKSNPEKRRAIGLAYYYRHRVLKGKAPLIDPEIKRRKAVERTRAWIKKNPERRQEQQRNRRAKKRANGGIVKAAEWLALKAKYNYTCLRCGRREPDITLTLDHVLPLAMGGKHEIGNAQPLCYSCNASKQAKHIDYRKDVRWTAKERN